MCNDMCMHSVRITLVQDDHCGSNSPSTSTACVEVYYYYGNTEVPSMSLIMDVQEPIAPALNAPLEKQTLT
jgi:hypothetical protein